jgi:hypothetical protein
MGVLAREQEGASRWKRPDETKAPPGQCWRSRAPTDFCKARAMVQNCRPQPKPSPSYRRRELRRYGRCSMCGSDDVAGAANTASAIL